MIDRYDETPENDDEVTERNGAGMSDEDFAAEVGARVGDAIDYIDQDVAPKRIKALGRYRGDPMGDEEEGRSQVVMTELRDVVLAMLPDLVETFTGTERVVEFAPRTEHDVDGAAQATDYVDYVFYTENHGFKVLWSGFKNALRDKTGVLHWYLDETEVAEELDYSSLTQEELSILENDDGVEVLTTEPEEPGEPELISVGEPALPPEPTFTARIKRTEKRKRVKVECLPPEDFFIARDARDEDHAKVIGHRSRLTVSDLVAMGYDEDEIRAHMGSDGYETNTERQERVPTIQNGASSATSDPASEELTYFQAFVRIDKDGDGIAELRRVCGLGTGASCHVLHDEVWGDGAPYGLLCPDPEPHTAIGDGMDDQVGDLQDVKTRVVRNTLDSLAEAIHPRTVILDGQVNVDDAMNTEIGAVVRERVSGAVRELAKPFVGQYSLPFIAYLDDTKARRTGVTDGPNAGDAAALQSTTKDAVTATVSASTARVKMVARIFAETGLRRMYRGVLQLAVRNIDKPQMIRLRKKFVPVDPRSWDATMDVIVDVGAGDGSQRLQALAMALGKQELIVSTFGPDNPLVSAVEYRNTLGAFLEASGIRDVSKHFKQVDPKALAEAAAKAAQNPPPNPAMILAQVEMAKAQVQKQEADQRHVRELLKIALEDDRGRQKMQFDHEAKSADIEGKYHVAMHDVNTGAAAQQDHARFSALLQAITQAVSADADQAHAAQQADADRSHTAQQADLDRAHQAELARSQAPAGAA
jgi:hypothetical protein